MGPSSTPPFLAGWRMAGGWPAPVMVTERLSCAQRFKAVISAASSAVCTYTPYLSVMAPFPGEALVRQILGRYSALIEVGFGSPCGGKSKV